MTNTATIGTQDALRRGWEKTAWRRKENVRCSEPVRGEDMKAHNGLIHVRSGRQANWSAYGWTYSPLAQLPSVASLSAIIYCAEESELNKKAGRPCGKRPC